MASESTVVSDHYSAPEQVEKMNEEVKKVEQEILLLPKSNGEEEKLKAEKLPSQPTPASEVEEKIEDKQIESFLAQELKKTDDTPVWEVSVEDKPDTYCVPESVADSTKSQPEDQPAIEAVAKQVEETPKMGDVSEPSVVTDSGKRQPEEQPETESVEKKLEEQPPVEAVEKQPEEQKKIGDTPKTSVDAVERTEEVEVLPVKESETVVVKDTEDSEAEPRKEEIRKQVTEVENKPQEQSEVVEQVEKECEGVGPKETLKVEIAKDEDASTGKIEDPLLKEEQTDREESVVTDKPLEQFEAAEKVEEECAGVEPKDTVKIEITKDGETSAQEQSEGAEKVEEECTGVEPKEIVKVEIEKDREILASKVEDPLLKEGQTDKEEPIVMDKAQEQSESAEKIEEECAGIEPKETVKVEIAKNEDASTGKIEDPLLKEEQADKEEPVVTDKPLEQFEVAEKVEKECAGVDPKETVKVEIEKDGEISVGKIEDPLLKEGQTDKEELIVTDKAQEQSETAQKIEEECAEVELKETVNVEIANNREIPAGKIEDPLLKEGQTDKEEPDKEEPVVTDKPLEQSDAAEKVEEECVGVEPKETMKVEIEKDGETSGGKVEDPLLKEKQTDKEEPVVTDKPLEQSDAAEKVDKECVGFEPKETIKVEIEKDGETSAGKVEDPLLKEKQTDKEEPVVTDIPLEQSDTAEKVEEECADVEPKEAMTVEIAKDEEALVGKIEDPLLKEEQTDKVEPVVKDKAQEPSRAAEKSVEECAKVELEESSKVEISKEEETLAEKIEDPQLKEQPNKEGPVVMESSDQFISTNVEAQVDTLEDGVENSPAVVIAENANIDYKEREFSGTNVDEGSKDEVVESGKVELVSEGKNVKTAEENEEKKAITEESDEPKTNKVEDVSSSISPTDVTEKSLEVDKTSRDIEMDTENGKESTKDETDTPVKSEKNGEVDGVTTTTVQEPAEVPHKSETEVEGEETVQTGETNLEKEKEPGEIAKPDVPAPESTKEVDDDTKTSRELPKEEVSTKPSKHSNNILAKVKQSLVKAKKAILGKSPNSKTVSSETKGDVKDK